MSRRCDWCKRGSQKAVSRSKSMKKTLRWMHINLQTKRLDGKVYKICTKCLKTYKKKMNEK